MAKDIDYFSRYGEWEDDIFNKTWNQSEYKEEDNNYDVKVNNLLDELENDPEFARKFFNELRKRKLNKIKKK